MTNSPVKKIASRKFALYLLILSWGLAAAFIVTFPYPGGNLQQSEVLNMIGEVIQAPIIMLWDQKWRTGGTVRILFNTLISVILTFFLLRGMIGPIIGVKNVSWFANVFSNLVWFLSGLGYVFRDL